MQDVRDNISLRGGAGGSWWAFISQMQQTVGRASELSSPALLALVHDAVANIPDVLTPPQRLVARALVFEVMERIERGNVVNQSHRSALPTGRELREQLSPMIEQRILSVESELGDLRVKTILNLIDVQFANKTVLLRQISDHTRLSRNYARRLLVGATGITFGAHLRRRRITAAQHLLMTSHLSIKEIAVVVGYQRTSQLDREFRKLCGSTPKQFRLVGSVNNRVAPLSGERADL